MTTDTTDLHEQIAEELYYEENPEGRHRNDWRTEHPHTRREFLDRAAAVLPIVDAAVKAGKAEAFRGAADLIEDMRNGAEVAEVVAYVPGEVGRQSVIDSFEAVMEEPGDWLRSLADSREADTYREDYVNDALAEAWDEGQESGWDEARDQWAVNGAVGDAWKHAETPNPYRETGDTDEH